MAQDAIRTIRFRIFNKAGRLVRVSGRNALRMATNSSTQSRRILLMRADGYKYEEISAKTDLSVSGVKMQVKRNLAKLRSALDVTILTFSTTLLLKWLLESTRSGLG